MTLAWLARCSLLTAALLVSACGASRREKPPETVPDLTLPDGTPVPVPERPRPRQVEPETVERVSPVFLSVFAGAHPSTTVTMEGVFAVPDVTRTFVMLEALVQPRQGLGVGAVARLVSAPGNVPRSMNASVLLGARQLALEAGIGSRDGFRPASGEINDSTYQTALLGVRSRLNLWETPLSVHAQYARLVSLTQSGSGSNPAHLKGSQFEAGLTWSLTRWPIGADLRYRQEHFQVYNRVQDVSGLAFGLAVLLGRRPIERPDSAAAPR